MTRDGLMFVLGAIGFLHEVFVSGPTEHPFLLAASAALMGLPFIFQGPTDSGSRDDGSATGSRWRRPQLPARGGRDWEEHDADPEPRRPHRRVETDEHRPRHEHEGD